MPPKSSYLCQQLINDHAADAVVFGHSHKHGVAMHHGILFVNPGSAGVLFKHNINTTCALPNVFSQTHDIVTAQSLTMLMQVCRHDGHMQVHMHVAVRCNYSKSAVHIP